MNGILDRLGVAGCYLLAAGVIIGCGFFLVRAIEEMEKEKMK